MKQFNLTEWLQNKSRKVVTRDGREVRIVFTEAQNDNYPILALVQQKTETQKEQPHLFSTHGVYEVGRESCLDLFFADEEEELTEFEQCLKSGTNIYVEQGRRMEDWDAKEDAKDLLDLARKELQPEFDKELDKAYKTQDDVVYRNGYAQGKQDALKAILDSLTDKEKIIKEPFEFPSLGRDDCYHGGPCTNPFHDCINCPRQLSGNGTTISNDGTNLNK